MIEQFDRLARSTRMVFFDLTTANIRSLFPNPTLIQLDGDRSGISCLSRFCCTATNIRGCRSCSSVLAKYTEGLPRFDTAVSLATCAPPRPTGAICPTRLITIAAGQGTTDGIQPDHADDEARIIEIAHGLPLFAAQSTFTITPAENPHYACITDPNGRNQNLAAQCSIASPWCTSYKGVCTMAFNDILPGCDPGMRPARRTPARYRQRLACLVEDMLTLECITRGSAITRGQLHLVESHLNVHIPEPRQLSNSIPTADVDLKFANRISSRTTLP